MASSSISSISNFEVEWQKNQLELLEKAFPDIDGIDTQEIPSSHSSDDGFAGYDALDTISKDNDHEIDNESDIESGNESDPESDISDLDPFKMTENMQRVQQLLRDRNAIKENEENGKLDRYEMSQSVEPNEDPQSVTPLPTTPRAGTPKRTAKTYQMLFSNSPKRKIKRVRRIEDKTEPIHKPCSPCHQLLPSSPVKSRSQWLQQQKLNELKSACSPKVSSPKTLPASPKLTKSLESPPSPRPPAIYVHFGNNTLHKAHAPSPRISPMVSPMTSPRRELKQRLKQQNNQNAVAPKEWVSFIDSPETSKNEKDMQRTESVGQHIYISPQQKAVAGLRFTGHNYDDISWRFVHYDLSKLVQETSNIFKNKHNDNIDEDNVSPIDSSQSTNKYTSPLRMDWNTRLEWDFEAITNHFIQKWSRRINAAERAHDNPSHDAQHTDSAFNTMNTSKAIDDTQNLQYSKAKRDFISNDPFQHLYGDAVLRNLKSQRNSKNQAHRPNTADQPRRYKARKTTTKYTNQQSTNILNDKLHESLSAVYRKLNRFQNAQIIKEDFISICCEYIESQYHANSHYLRHDWLPKLCDIMTAYEYNVRPLSREYSISSTNFIKHMAIVLSKRHFINAAKHYISILKATSKRISTRNMSTNQKEESTNQQTVTFNPDVLRLAAIMLSKLTFSVRLLPKHNGSNKVNKVNRVNKHKYASRREYSQSIGEPIGNRRNEANDGSRSSVFSSSSSSSWGQSESGEVFLRLYAQGMKQKHRLSQRSHSEALSIDEECTFRPKLMTKLHKKSYPKTTRKSDKTSNPSSTGKSKSCNKNYFEIYSQTN